MISFAKKLLCGILMTGCVLTAQQVEQSKLANTQYSITFEKEQITAFSKLHSQLNDNVRELQRQKITDKQILLAIDYREQAAKLVQDIRDANIRQATLAEQINALLQQPTYTLSAQEQIAYRDFKHTLQTLAGQQNQLQNATEKLLKYLSVYLKNLPPPTTFKLGCNLEMKLVMARPRPFYVSGIIPQSLVEHIKKAETTETPLEPIADNDNARLAVLNHYDAVRLASTLSKLEGVPLKLPEQLHFNAMDNNSLMLKTAVWSGIPFTPKASLAEIHRKDTDTSANFPRRLQLSNAQQDAAARFKMPFMLVWDPSHIIGDETFTRELPMAAYDELGTILVADAQFGVSRRLAAILKQRQTAPQP